MNQTVGTHFKFGAAVDFCLTILFEKCEEIFGTDNTILSNENRYLTNLRMEIQKETYTDEIHRNAFLDLKEIS